MPFIKNISIQGKKKKPAPPVEIILGSISAGPAATHTIYVSGSGIVWGWGNNAVGQIGDNTSGNSKSNPVSVLGATKTFCQISAGSANFSSGLDKNGRVWTWGSNSAGMLGINSIVSQRTPVSILGATKTFCKIAAGGAHMLAIDKNGRLWSWGSNTNGQLGDNSITSRRTPVSVLGATKTFCMISGGANHSVAIDKNGAVWAWGQNLSGQLGDNSVTSRLTPVRVCNI